MYTVFFLFSGKVYICEIFCSESCLSFNVNKSKALLFGRHDTHLVVPLRLNEQCIEFVSSWKYLGCTVDSGRTFAFSIGSELGAFYASANSILRSLRKPNELVLMNLLCANCVPCLTYCAEVKSLSNADMQKCNVALNDSIRRIFSFQRWESTRQLRQQFSFPNIYEIFESRRNSFTRRNANIPTVVIREVTRHLFL